MTTYEANLFHLQGHGTKVDYSTTSIAGVPLFTLERGKDRHSFKGDEIRVQETELGRFVSVTIEAVPDLQTTTFTVAFPQVNLDGRQGTLETFAVVTVTRTSIGGPRLVKGQVQTYETLTLKGDAQAVDF